MKYLKFALPLMIFIFFGSSQNKNKLESEKAHTINSSAEKAKKIDSLLNIYSSYGQFTGSVLIAENSTIIYKNGFGLANIEWNVQNKPSTKHRLASVSKQFTAAVIVKLASVGKLNIDDNISKYLPEFPSEKANQITIHHLLTHSSGLPNYTSFPDYRDNMKKSFTPESLTNLFVDSTLVFTPGERFEYSNSGYVLLGLIAEKIENKPFEKILKETILMPLGMANTGMQADHKVVDEHSSGYNTLGSSYNHASFINMSVAYTAGGIYSTVEDLFKWDQALYSDKIFSQKWKDKLFSEHIPAWGDYYAYGWMIRKRRLGNSSETVRTIEHDGVINGYNSMFIRIPSSKATIIILSNVSGSPINKISQQILGILNEKPYDFPKKSIPLTISHFIRNNGLKLANEKLDSLFHSDEYFNNERDMNLVGYEFLENGLLEEAAFIFRKNIAQFPHSSNVYDSYGEIQLKLGKKAEAIEQYKKSILLNPNNINGKEVLANLGVAQDEFEKLTLNLLKSDLEWQNEIFHFPLRFASEIPYKGREDARFPPGWRNEKSDEFWSYVFAWHIDKNSDVTKEELESNLETYFDGLMKVVNRNPEVSPDPTKAEFNFSGSKLSDNTMNGTIDIFDAFVTNKKLKLHSTVEQHLLDKGKSVLIFRFSPKDYTHKIWEELNTFKVLETIYEY